MAGLNERNTGTPLSGNKTISVIVPCYNSEKYLGNCFSCLDNSAYKNLEIIFVDDGSTDNTAEIIKRYAAERENVLYERVNHTGVAGARNKGLELAGGEYITFYDADDEITPNHFSNLKRALESTEADVSVCAFKRKHVKDKKNGKPCKVKIFTGNDCEERLLCQNTFDYCLWNKLYRAEIIKENGLAFPVGARYGEDSYFNYFYFKNVKKAAFSTAPTYNYKKNEGSLVRESFKESRLDIFNNLKVVIDDAEKSGGAFTHSAHAARALFITEALYFILKFRYKNKAVTNKLVTLLKQDLKHLKKCKRVALYRRLLIPLVPVVAAAAFGKTGKQTEDSLPENFKD